MRLSLVASVMLLALGCSQKKPPAVDPKLAEVCKHISDVCGEMAHYDVCLRSAKAMRANNLEGALEAEACALQKKSCQEISMCSMKGGKKIIRTSLRNAKEKIERAKKELDPPVPEATSEPAK
jgi:hypothetical protein